VAPILHDDLQGRRSKMNFRFSPVAALALVSLAPGFAAAPAQAQPATAVEPRLVSVSGEGEVKVKPDQAMLSAGVVTQGKTAADALAANSRAMNAVFATLKRLGIPDRSIQTSNFSVNPQYPEYNSKEPRRIVSYQVSNTVSVTVDDLSKLGPALDALVSSGANSLGDIALTIRDPKPRMAQAREAAVKDAMAKADTLARAAGVSLGPIIAINEGVIAPPQPLYRAMTVTGARAPETPISAGESTVSATVSMSWEIR
jgi:uncharacterized protein YggE